MLCFPLSRPLSLVGDATDEDFKKISFHRTLGGLLNRTAVNRAIQQTFKIQQTADDRSRLIHYTDTESYRPVLHTLGHRSGCCSLFTFLYSVMSMVQTYDAGHDETTQ